MKMRNLKITTATLAIGIIGLGSVFFTSCKSDPNSAGFEFMPDMYRSPSVEPYVDYGEIRGKRYDSLRYMMSARKPVDGTVPRGFTPTVLGASNKDYYSADSLLKAHTGAVNPVQFNDDIAAEGKDLYIKMCSHCHGEKGAGDGLVVENGGFPPPPSYSGGQSSRGGKLSDLTAGQIYHTITYGLNNMGPHASQISPEDRWKIVYHVQELQGNSPKKEEVKADATEPSEEMTSEEAASADVVSAEGGEE